MSTTTSAPPASTIRLRQVRTHNLKGIDLDLPLGTAGRRDRRQRLAARARWPSTRSTPRASGATSRRSRPTPASSSRRSTSPTPTGSRAFRRPSRVAGRESVPSTRSTVGTIAEIHDYLGLLYRPARRGRRRHCGHPVVPATPRLVARAIDELPEGTRYEIGFPLEILPGVGPAAIVRSLAEDGFTRVRIDGQTRRAGVRRAARSLRPDGDPYRRCDRRPPGSR